MAKEPKKTGKSVSKTKVATKTKTKTNPKIVAKPNGKAKEEASSKREPGKTPATGKRATPKSGGILSDVVIAEQVKFPTIALDKIDFDDFEIGPYIPFPIFQDHVRNLFETSRAGRPAVRDTDLLAFRVETQGLDVIPENPPRLKKSSSGAAQLILHFPPQSFAEQAFFQATQPTVADPSKPDEGGSETLTPPPVRARIAHESRLVFNVPDDFNIEYSLESVLGACRDLSLKVAANARPRQAPSINWQVGTVVTDIVESTTHRQRARMASAALTAIRIGAVSGDIATLEAREVAIGSGLKLQNVFNIVKIPPRRLVKIGPKPAKPGATTTSIEMPWRLLISPHDGVRWSHATKPVSSPSSGRAELWHSSMFVPGSQDKGILPPYPDESRTIRAIWALNGSGPEAPSTPMQSNWPTGALPVADNSPFRATLDDKDRCQLVHLSSNFSKRGYSPEPVDTNMLMLSSLGGWLNSRGAWDPPGGFSVEEWVNRATMGRDHYVRVVYKGFLFPFGHRVSLIKVTERKFHNGAIPLENVVGNVAYLRQRMFIVVREPERTFGDQTMFNIKRGSEHPSLRFPFTRVKILTEVTPDIDDPAGSQSKFTNLTREIFWPHVGQKPFRFQCAATDFDNRRILFDLPMIFVDNELISTSITTAEQWAKTAADEYANPTGSRKSSPGEEFNIYNSANLKLQRVALAPGIKSGDTTVMSDRMTFGGFTASNNSALRAYSNNMTRPLWMPQMTKTDAQIGPISHLSGQDGASRLTYSQIYLQHGFTDGGGPNKGEIFVDVSSGPNLDFSTQGDKSGGFIQPNMKPAALSRFAGPVMSNPTNFAAGSMGVGAGFPVDLSDLPLPLLFGCIPLGSIIGPVADVIGESDKVPKFVSEASTVVESFLNGLIRLYEFVTGAASQPAGIAKAAMATFGFTLDDLVQQAQSYSPAQVQPIVDAVQNLKGSISALASQLENLAELDIDQAVTSPDLSSLPAAIATARGLANSLRDAANATPGGVSLPAGFRQNALNAAQKIDAVLADIETIQALVSSGKSLWDALSDLVAGDSTFANLLTDPEAMRVRVEALEAAIGPFRTALGNVRLLEGSPRNTLLEALQVVEEILDGAGDLLKLIEMLTGDELTIRFDWNPEISNWNIPDGFNASNEEALFRANNKRGLLVAVVAKVKKDGSASPSISVTCSLKHFDLVLIAPASFIELNFEKIEFSVNSAAKMDVDVLLSDIKFVGPLSFVETLRDLIPLDGFSDPPYLDITAQGIDAGFDISLPSITCGVLNISNLSLGAGFTVPFIGEPLSVRFNFCRREQPFLLTVYIFGGGGFFSITIDPSGVQILEAAFEFGAAFSIDFGVASGGVEVMAGIYFRMEDGAAELTGYFRLGGYVDVLGLISASIELYLELRYEFETGKCVGRAELTIEVSVFVFSGSVTIKCERKFAGSNGDPNLRQMLGHQPDLSLADELASINADTEYAWREHFEAFA